ncbi:hypothetical protein COCMIDRAFT_108166, partial [Bipolaris oryzae ATCC 44560]
SSSLGSFSFSGIYASNVISRVWGCFVQHAILDWWRSTRKQKGLITIPWSEIIFNRRTALLRSGFIESKSFLLHVCLNINLTMKFIAAYPPVAVDMGRNLSTIVCLVAPNTKHD